MGLQLAKNYCPAAPPDLPFRQLWCRDCLMPAISDYWKFKYERLCGERTFADALNGIQYSGTMLEILAVFHYAKTDPAVAALMPKLFLELEGKQRPAATPYWNRFVAEYKKPRPRPVAMCDLLYTLETMPLEEFAVVVEVVERRRNERK